MEFISAIVFAGFLFGCCIVGAAVATRLTRDFERGRGALVLGGFSAPALFVIYLFLASHLREEFHRQRSEAYWLDPNCTLPLGHDFELSYFDEMPSSATITRGGVVLLPGIAPPNYIRSVAILGEKIYVETGSSNLSIDPPNGFFSVDLISGEVRKFQNGAQLQADFPEPGHLDSPDAVFQAAEARQRGRLFWPCIAAAPLVLMPGLALVRRKLKKPAKIPAGS